jgi:hypothetical protein
MGSCLIHLPKDKYKAIVSYPAVIYETDIPAEKEINVSGVRCLPCPGQFNQPAAGFAVNL